MARTSEDAAQDNRKVQRSQGKQQTDSGDVEDKTASRMGVYLFSLAVFAVGTAVVNQLVLPVTNIGRLDGIDRHLTEVWKDFLIEQIVLVG